MELQSFLRVILTFQFSFFQLLNFIIKQFLLLLEFSTQPSLSDSQNLHIYFHFILDLLVTVRKFQGFRLLFFFNFIIPKVFFNLETCKWLFLEFFTSLRSAAAHLQRNFSTGFFLQPVLCQHS